jgi:hypothetical protein
MRAEESADVKKPAIAGFLFTLVGVKAVWLLIKQPWL